jgi:hypothetical protein
MKEFEINFVSFEFWFWFKLSLNCAARCYAAQARVSVPHHRPVSLPFALSCSPLLTPGPASPWSCSTDTFTHVTFSPTATILPCLWGQWCHPHLTARGHYRPPRAADRHARGPFHSLLLPLSRIQNKCRPPPHAPFSALLSSHPCPSTSPPSLCS